jgi:adenine-specific DNA methylase
MTTFALEKDPDGGYIVRHVPSKLLIASLRYKAEAVALHAAAEALAAQHPNITKFNGEGDVREVMGVNAFDALHGLAYAHRQADRKRQIQAEAQREQRKKIKRLERYG